ncbi:MAG: ABC transporter permease [Candidatus Neomarinimicrobiota bacterium]|nr:MAG: hypothetical protein CBC68_04680 [Candidatus Marinimicrobia bacterium TMED108]RCL90681.1 MAG: ABC transporter permease [bacterium]
MKISLLFALKHIKSDHKSGFVKTATILSVFGLSIGISSLLITLSILNGFERVISEKITKVDGHIRIKHFLSEPFNSIKYDVENKLSDNLQGVSIGSFTQNSGLLRKGQLAEGVIVEGIHLDDLNFIKEMIVEGSSHISSKGIIIGKRLADVYKIRLNDKITVFDLSSLYLTNKNFMQFKVEGIFHSGMTEYDKSSVFIDISNSNILFNLDEKISGYVLRIKDINKITDLNKAINSNISYPLMSITWKEKNRALYKWLNVQRWPILFIFSLIAIVAIINIISSLSMIVIDKTKQIGLLSAIGMPLSKIRDIFFIKGLIIGFLGTAFGSFIAITLAILQNNFKIIEVPEDIYFMNFIPIDINYFQVLVISIITLIVSSLVSIWPAMRSTKILPSQALKYE